MISYWYFAAIGLLVLLSAFFSAAEMAYSSANGIRLENAADSGSRRARAACFILSRFDDALSTILIGNNLVNMASSSMATVVAITVAGERWAPLSAAAMTVLIIVFGETMPKIIAKRNANRLALSFSFPVRALMALLMPVLWVVVGLVRLITKPMRGEASHSGEAAVEELVSIIETVEDEGVIDEGRSELLQAALDFSEISASEVMTSRVDMAAIDIDDDWEDILPVIDGAIYSRLPVYEDSVDNIIGVLYLNRFYKALIDSPKPDIRALLMPPCHVYKTMKLPMVLAELRRRKTHLAVVTDDYGGTMGVLTMEDVLEELVGDIWDETDEIESYITENPDGSYVVCGDLGLGDFLDFLDIDERELETQSATVGGWTLEMSRGFPSAGDSFKWGGLTVTVLEIDGLRVGKVHVAADKPRDAE